MAQPPPPLARKSSAPWDRLRPVKQDPLESMGFVSKGDNRLLDVKAQESFYNKIVARYMQFCTRHSKDLDRAFASLSLTENTQPDKPRVRDPGLSQQDVGSYHPGQAVVETTLQTSTELSSILLALRKLREGLLASSAPASNAIFSQRVHVFNIRASILAFHPQSYHPSLLHLLSVLHTPEHPLPRSELVEMTTYLILDTAIRQKDITEAYTLRYKSRRRFAFQSRIVDSILKSLVTGDWVAFWRTRQKVDGYVRAILSWHLDSQRKIALKAIGRAYYSCEAGWILQSSTGGEMTWEELVEREDVGWIREGDKVLIRKPKIRAG